MSHPVQIPADVQREDVLLGRLTARQLAALTLTAAAIYTLWRLLGPAQLGWFAVTAVPVAVLGATVVFGRRDGMPVDRLALAALGQWASLRRLPRAPRPTAAPGSGSGRRAAPCGWLGARRPIRVGPVLRGVYPVGSDGVGVLDLGADGSAVVCAVTPVNLSLRSPREQDAVIAGFARWLHSLSGPVQILTRTQPLDLSGPIARLYRAAPRLGSDALTSAAFGHAAHLAVMGEHAELLHHEFLIVYRDPTPALHTRSPRSTPAAAGPGARARGAGARAAVAAEALRRRAGEAAALLGPLGLRVTPLTAPQAAHVLHRATAPAPTGSAPTGSATGGAASFGGSFASPRGRETDYSPVNDTWSGTWNGSAEASTVELPVVGSRPGGRGGFDPGAVLVGSRRVGLGGVWSASLVVTGYPREVPGAGWLTPVTGHPGLVDVSLHITPVNPALAAGQLRRQLARLESARRSTSTHDRLPDPDVDAAAADAHYLAERVARGETRLFTTTLTITVTATSEAELDAELGAVRALLASLLITAHPCTGRAWQAWRTGLPLGRDLIDTGRILDTTALAAAFPFASPDLPPPHPAGAGGRAGEPSTAAAGGGGGGSGSEVLLGYNLASSSLVFWDRWKADNYNSVVLGRSGAGKSYLVKLELLRSLYSGVHAHVIDPEDEYVRLAHAVDGTVVRIGAPNIRINPLDLDIHTDPGGRRSAAPDALARRRLALHSFLSLALTTTDHPPAGAGGVGGGGAQLSPAERAVLDEAITHTYTRAGITDDPATWTRPAPLLRDLYATLTQQPTNIEPTDTEPADAGVVPGRITRALHPGLHHPANPADTDEPADQPGPDHEPHPAAPPAPQEAAAQAMAGAVPGVVGEVALNLARGLRPFVDGAFAGLFDGHTTHPGTGSHLVVWSLRELPEQLRSLATMLVLDTIWRTVTHPHDRRRRMVVVDEAWLLLQHPAGARFLLRAAKAGRKHWCGLTVATQDTADVLASDLGRAVITNSATQILLRQAPQAIDQVSRVFGLSAGERALLLTAERGDGLLTGGEHRAGFTALASAGEDRLITTDPAHLAPSTEDRWIDLDPPPPPTPPYAARPHDPAAPRLREVAW